MVQPAKKSSNPKKSQPVIDIAEAAQETQKKICEAGFGNIEDITRAANTCNQMVGQLMDLCTDSASALIESNSKIFHAIQNMNSECMEDCNRALSDIMEISKEAFGCRTINDMIDLQNTLIQRICDNYFDGTRKMSDMLFSSYDQTLKPIQERTFAMSEKIRDAVAA